MPSTNVICFTLVLFLRQEVIKYRQIFMLRGDFFWVWNIISWFVKIALNWLFGTSLLIFWQLFNQLVWWNLFSQYFITVFKNSHYHLFWQLFFKTFFQNFILLLKQNWQFRIVQPARSEKKVQQQCSLTTAWFAHNQAPQALWQQRVIVFICHVFIPWKVFNYHLFIKAFNKWINYIVLNVDDLRKRKTSNRKQQKATVKFFKASVLFAEWKIQNL